MRKVYEAACTIALQQGVARSLCAHPKIDRTVTVDIASRGHIQAAGIASTTMVSAVDGDPLTDVTVLTSMDFVMRDGRVYRDEE